MDPDVLRNRIGWEVASEKHVREYRELLDVARHGSSLFAWELDLLRPLLAAGRRRRGGMAGAATTSFALIAERRSGS